MTDKNLNNVSVLDAQIYPFLPTRGLVLLPGMSVNFDVGRLSSIAAIESAMKQDQMLVISCQKDIDMDEPGMEDVYSIGVLARVNQILRISEDTVRVLVKAVRRVRILSLEKTKKLLLAQVLNLDEKALKADTPKNEALIRTLKELYNQYCERIPKSGFGIASSASRIRDIGKLCDFIAANSFIDFTLKQRLLDQISPVKRANELIKILTDEIQVLNIELEISEKVKEQMDSNQRDYYLKEQIKAIQSELGDNPDVTYEELEQYEQSIKALATSDEVKQKLLKEVDKMAKMPPMSHEASVIRSYLDTVLEMPFGKKTKECFDIERARKILDRDHYGLEKVKERVLEQIAVRSLCQAKGQILCLVGAPGVGKTSIVKSIATAMNRNYARISLGGIHDEAEIRGHRRTYIGAMPGRITAAVKEAQSQNPIILLDEIDKMSTDFKGDSAAALLEVLDSEQNVGFVDHYLDIPFDLSDVFFITTANTLDTISRPLLDRMEVIELDSYLDTEKEQICKGFLIPKQRKKHGLNAKQIKITLPAIRAIISGYTREAGVRRLERCIAKIMRKAAMKIVEKTAQSVTVTEKNLDEYLGIRKYHDEPLYEAGACGIVNGLAWTSVGGEMLNVEVSVLEGSGKIELTGSLGEVMQESAKAAVSYIRSVAKLYDIQPDFYKTKDIHIHFPEGAVPKDGPSAGITIATALFSALTLNPIDNKLAMTGEITLTGRVLPIGGLKEKTMAAYKHSITRVIIPYGNISDLEEIDSTVRRAIKFIPVHSVGEVFKHAAVYPTAKDSGSGDSKVPPISQKPTNGAAMYS